MKSPTFCHTLLAALARGLAPPRALAEVYVQKLPAAAGADFARDIRPLLEGHA